MGCERLADPTAPPNIQRFQILLSLMLSSQTKDQITAQAMHKLQAFGCTPQAIAAAPTETIQDLIYPVGFYKNKARFLKAAAKTCIQDYKGDIPPTLDQLLTIKGVGPKMAHIAMHAAWGKGQGIGVDTHVHRIANRLRWVPATKTPEQTREKLEQWLPKSLWGEINLLLVGFGQTTCLPTNPRCQDCALINLCPAAKRPRNNKRTRDE
jgi:endonuclease III